jgi:3-methyladenine DNA glycosylase AlkD
MTSPARAAADARRALKRMARPAGTFDASGYFRGADDLRFYNVGTPAMRALARSIHATNRDHWSIRDATAFADTLIKDRYLEVKSVGIELVARYRRDFTPGDLDVWKRWLEGNHSANWATTDAICGALSGPLLVRYPELGARMRLWARDRNMWVRRASIVSLIPLARRGESLGLVYEIARRLHGDSEDLIQKAVGWALREAGKADMARLERYLRANGASIPRTTLRYAIERFPEPKRRALLAATRTKRGLGLGIRD